MFSKMKKWLNQHFRRRRGSRNTHSERKRAEKPDWPRAFVRVLSNTASVSPLDLDFGSNPGCTENNPSKSKDDETDMKEYHSPVSQLILNSGLNLKCTDNFPSKSKHNASDFKEYQNPAVTQTDILSDSGNSSTAQNTNDLSVINNPSAKSKTLEMRKKIFVKRRKRTRNRGTQTTASCTVSVGTQVEQQFLTGHGEYGKRQIINLPDEIVFEICRYIPKDSSFCALKSSCRRFHELLRHPTLWKSAEFCAHTDLIPQMFETARSASDLKSVNLENCLNVTDVFLAHLARCCPNIEHINVSGCYLVSDVGIGDISEYLDTIVSMSVASTRLVSCEALLNLLVKHGDTMKHLDLSFAIGLEQDFFKMFYVPRRCPNLEYLSIRCDPNFATLVLMWRSRISQFATFCHKLKFLSLSGCPIRDFKDVANVISRHSHNLHHLDLSFCNLNNQSLAKICNNIMNLRHLDISSSGQVSNLGIMLVARRLKYIDYLNISGCVKVTNVGVRAILTSLILREFHLRQCFRVSDDGVVDTTFICPSLCLFDLSGTMISNSSLTLLRQRAQPALVIVAENCPFIRGVDDSLWDEMPSDVMNLQDHINIEFARDVHDLLEHERI